MIGRKVGPYEVVAKVGEGGMGEVYRARDVRLGRDVAIKVLPAAVALDPDRIARFDREARLLASLNHPNIAHIYGVETLEPPFDSAQGRANGKALVMELVEGDTLAGAIARGPLPVRDALRIAGQIADALDAAHARGVIHRDLKPANIKITPQGQVKVLDFGLAKAFGPSELDADLSQLPTVTSAGTREGMVLGTAAYMSPEQARGLAVDKRTDIWAFGCVLYEMLTGRRAFPGATMSDTIAAILQRDPDWSALPATLPPDAARLLRRCLEKDASRRLRDIGNTRADLDESMSSPSTAMPATTAAPSQRPAWIFWLAVAAAIILGTMFVTQRFGWFQPAAETSSESSSNPSRFVESVTGGLQLGQAPSIALSDDGRHLAYVAVKEGTKSLYIRDIDDVVARPLAGTQDADQPFFSPDGHWIGFFAENKLKKVPVTGGAPTVLTSVSNPRGGAWLPDNTIIFAPSAATVLMRVSAEGTGKAEPASTLDGKLNEASHRWPHVLPGGNAILYAAGPTVSARAWMEAHIVAQSLTDNRRSVIATHGSFPRFLSSGHLVYAQSGVPFAQRFDPKSLQTTGDAFPILERISGGGVNGGSLHWATSRASTMAYVPGFDLQVELVLRERDKDDRVVLPAGSYNGPRLSADGKFIAVTIVTGTDSDIWIHDVGRGTTSKLTSGGRNLWPVWSPDGRRVAYASSREGSTNVYWRAIDGSGSEEQLTRTAHTFVPQRWTHDGSHLILTEVRPDQPNGVVLMSTTGEHTIERFATGEGPSTMGALSPDGHWMAFMSDESGRNEVYVRPYPGPGPAVQVSTMGGDEPLWSGRGLELVFRRGEAYYSAGVTAAKGGITASSPVKVFEGRYAPAGVRTGFDVSADGRIFLFVKNVQPRENLSQIKLVLGEGLAPVR